MLKLYKVDNKTESDVKGYWKDGSGKLYIDRIQIESFKGRTEARESIKNLFDKGEQAVFYTFKNKAMIEDRQGTITELRHKRIIRGNELNNGIVNGLLETYNGLTIWSSAGQFTIETWS